MQGGDPNATTDKGETLLHYATYSGNKDLVRLLVIKGADVNAMDEDHFTPLINSVRGQGNASRLHEITVFLLENGAEDSLWVKDKLNYMTSFLWALSREKYSTGKALGQKMFEKNENWAFINDTAWGGKTALHLVARDLVRRDTDISTLKWLIEREADVNLRDGWGRTPLYLFIEELLEEDEDDFYGPYDSEIISYFLSSGANPNITNNQKYPLLNLLKEKLDEEKLYENDDEDTVKIENIAKLIQLLEAEGALSINEDEYHYSSMVEGICKTKKEQSGFKDLEGVFSGDLKCSDYETLYKLWKEDASWIEHSKEKYSADWEADLWSFEGEITLNTKPSIKIARQLIPQFSPIPLNIYYDYVMIDIDGREFSYWSCKNLSDCEVIAKEWRQKFRDGYQMKISFNRSWRRKFGSSHQIDVSLDRELNPNYNAVRFFDPDSVFGRPDYVISSYRFIK